MFPSNVASCLIYLPITTQSALWLPGTLQRGLKYLLPSALFSASWNQNFTLQTKPEMARKALNPAVS
jgi:hypothetical protein